MSRELLPGEFDALAIKLKLTRAQETALRRVAAGHNDCENTATVVTRALRMKGLLKFGEVDGRVAYVLTAVGRAAIEAKGKMA